MERYREGASAGQQWSTRAFRLPFKRQFEFKPYDRYYLFENATSDRKQTIAADHATLRTNPGDANLRLGSLRNTLSSCWSPRDVQTNSGFAFVANAIGVCR